MEPTINLKFTIQELEELVAYIQLQKNYVGIFEIDDPLYLKLLDAKYLLKFMEKI